MHSDLLLGLVIVTALAFDFTNGFHDTANAMATSIATGALKPKVAVALAGALNVLGAFLSLAVAKTIASGIVDDKLITLNVVFAGLVGAIVWNLLTWLVGLPSSSSHALIGGLLGASLVAVGNKAVHYDTLLAKVIIPALIAPVLAGLIATVGTFLAYRLTRRTDAQVRTTGFRIGQIGSASLVSLAHGTNDAQKTMGVITLAMVANGSLSSNAGVPTWVIVACALAIGAGTYLGGWRIIRTLGKGVVEIESPQGFSAEAAASTVLLASSHFGYPLSTTHIASGAVIGSGVGKRLAEVRWSIAERMAAAWLLTLPAAALVAAIWFEAAKLIGGSTGVIVTGLAAAVLAAAIYGQSRRNPVNASNVNDPYLTEPTQRPAAIGVSA